MASVSNPPIPRAVLAALTGKDEKTKDLLSEPTWSNFTTKLEMAWNPNNKPIQNACASAKSTVSENGFTYKVQKDDIAAIMKSADKNVLENLGKTKEAMGIDALKRKSDQRLHAVIFFKHKINPENKTITLSKTNFEDLLTVIKLIEASNTNNPAAAAQPPANSAPPIAPPLDPSQMNSVPVPPPVQQVLAQPAAKSTSPKKGALPFSAADLQAAKLKKTDRKQVKPAPGGISLADLKAVSLKPRPSQDEQPDANDGQQQKDVNSVAALAAKKRESMVSGDSLAKQIEAQQAARRAERAENDKPQFQLRRTQSARQPNPANGPVKTETTEKDPLKEVFARRASAQPAKTIDELMKERRESQNQKVSGNPIARLQRANTVHVVQGAESTDSASSASSIDSELAAKLAKMKSWEENQ